MPDQGWITHQGVIPLIREGSDWRGNWKDKSSTRKLKGQTEDFMLIVIDDKGEWELQNMQDRGPFICSKSF